MVFGDHSPTGKLPITLPSSEAQTIAPTILPPGPSIPYAEGMASGYRDTTHTPAFPFGHGLSYSTFSFGAPRVAACDADAANLCVSTDVTNEGRVRAATVAQLYVRFPPAAQHPSKLLKGFAKTRALAPRESEALTFRLTPRDRSYYDAAEQRWVPVDGKALLGMIGASSADIRQRRMLHEDILELDVA